MEKGNRTELRKINLANNRFGNVGKNAIQGLKKKFGKI
jgi:hypothetical protein